jgi:bifunctional DNA-binding transcriptional regulator/antitoxin component of YhaV-PrlF toxin-antitoxin module
MTEFTVSPKYQIVIPKEIRESMGIVSRQKIFASAQKYSAVIWTQDNDFEGLVKVRYISKSNT